MSGGGTPFKPGFLCSVYIFGSFALPHNVEMIACPLQMPQVLALQELLVVAKQSHF